MSKQTTRLTTFVGLPKLEVHDAEHTPHWKRPGSDGAKGHAGGDFTLFGNRPENRCLSIDITEYSEGAKSSKRVMFTLDPAATRALRDLLQFEAPADDVPPGTGKKR